MQEQGVCNIWQKAQVTQGALDDKRGSSAPFDEANPGQVFVERNTQVKVEVQQGKVKKAKKSVDDFCVLDLFTKTYKKWFLCKTGKQSRKKDMDKSKFRVLMRMVEFDHSMG